MPKFVKSERLCSALAISHLFDKGFSLNSYPVKIKWLPVKSSNNHDVQVVISVSKNRFKKAVDRNRIKRLLRECYRQNKEILFNGLSGKQCHLAIIYTGKELPLFSDLQQIIIEMFHRLIKDYEKIAG